MAIQLFPPKKLSTEITTKLAEALQKTKNPLTEKELNTFRIFDLGKKTNEKGLVAKIVYLPGNIQPVFFDIEKDCSQSNYIKHNYEHDKQKRFGNKPVIKKIGETYDIPPTRFNVLFNGIRFDLKKNGETEVINPHIYRISIQTNEHQHHHIEFFAKTMNSAKWIYLPFRNTPSRDAFKNYVNGFDYKKLIK